MNALSTLATHSLLGTDRRAPQPSDHEGPVGDVLRSLAPTTPEKALLQSAGILGTCHLAGWKPPQVEQTATPCPADTRSQDLPESLKACLSGIFTDGPVRLQAETFIRITQAGYCLPYRWLAKALDCGRGNKALRPLLLPALGSRGTWLAAQNEAWAYAAGGSEESLDPQVWEHGSLEQRKLYLTRLRELDAAQARNLVITAFTTEAARERSAFMDCLTTNLSSEDEDLLESSLKDKSKEVRQTAAELLSTLPESRYAQRMIARLQPCLTMEKKFLRGTVITLEPPAAFGADWKNDLLEEAKPKHSQLGERAWWLFQIVRATPLTWWEKQTSLSPSELLAWAQKTDWKDALLQGWAAAQALQKQVAWAEAFLSVNLPPNSTLHPHDLLVTLPLPLREKHFLRLFESALKGQSACSLLDRFLASWPLDGPPLSHEIASPVIQGLKKYVNSGSARYDWQLRSSLVELACVLPRSLFAEATAHWDLTKPEVQSFAEAVARLSTVLDQRQQLHLLKTLS